MSHIGSDGYVYSDRYSAMRALLDAFAYTLREMHNGADMRNSPLDLLSALPNFNEAMNDFASPEAMEEFRTEFVKEFTRIMGDDVIGAALLHDVLN